MKYWLLIALVCAGCSQPVVTAPTKTQALVHIPPLPGMYDPIRKASSNCVERGTTAAWFSNNGRTVEFNNGAPCAMDYVFVIFRRNDVTNFWDQTLVGAQGHWAKPGESGVLAFPSATGCYQTDFYSGISLAEVERGEVELHPAHPNARAPLLAFVSPDTAACEPPPPPPPPPPVVDCLTAIRDVTLRHRDGDVEMTFSLAAGPVEISLVSWIVTPGLFLPQEQWRGVSQTFDAGGPYLLIVSMPGTEEWQVDGICGPVTPGPLTAENNADLAGRAFVTDFRISAEVPRFP